MRKNQLQLALRSNMTFRFILLFVFMFLFQRNSFAQTGRYFNLYGKDSMNNSFYNLLEFGSSYYAIGFANFFTTSGFLVKANAQSGQQMFDVFYKFADSNLKSQDIRGIVPINGSFYHTGYALYPDTNVERKQKIFPYLMKTDTNGTVLWWKKYEGIYEEYGGGEQIIQIDSNKIAILCWSYTQRISSPENRMVLLLVDTNGHLIKKRLYDPFQRKRAYNTDFIALKDGSLMVIGSNPYFNGWRKGVAMRIDTALNVMWAKEYNSQDQFTVLQHAAQRRNGNVLIVGTMNYSGAQDDYDGLLLEVNVNNGNVIKEKRFEPEFANFFDGIAILPDEKVVIGGAIDNLDTFSSDAAIWKLDSNWNVIWNYYYTQPYLGKCFSAENTYSFQQSSDGGFVFAGFSSNPLTCSQDGMIIKLDSNGCLTQGCSFVGIEQDPLWKSEIRIYPNPANELLHIDNAQHQTRLRIYSMQGSLVYEKEMLAEMDEIQLSTFSPGVYILEFENKQGLRQQERLVVGR